MSVIAIKKTNMPTMHKNKKAAVQELVAKGENVNNYGFFYIYKEQRALFAGTYKELHRKAALRSYHKNKTTTRPVGRPRKTDGNKQG